MVYKSNICFAGKDDDQITLPKSSNEDIEFQKIREERLKITYTDIPAKFE